MSFKENLSNLNLNEDTNVVFSYEQGADVFHFNETELDTVLSETDVVERVAVAATSNTGAGREMLNTLREQGLLEYYERGSGDFQEYVADTLRENFYYADMIEYSTEKYDHKRGFTTLSVQTEAPFGEVLNSIEDYNNAFSGWTAEVYVGSAKLSMEV